MQALARGAAVFAAALAAAWLSASPVSTAAGAGTAAPPGAGRCAQPALEDPGALEAATARARESGQPALAAGLELERGGRLAAAGQLEPALDAFAESRRLAEAGDRPALALRAGANGARAALELGRLEGLAAELATLEAGARALTDPAERAALLLHLGATLERLAEASPAERAGLRARAARTYAAAAEAAESASDPRLDSFALGFLAGLYQQDGRLADARELTRRALFAAQSADAPESLYRWQWQLGRIERATGDEGAALSAYRHAAVSLRELREGGAATGPAVGAASGQGVSALYSELVDLLLLRAARTPAGADEQALLHEARGTLEDLKAAELRDYFRDACLDVQRKAAPEEVPGAVVVYPIALSDRLELVVGKAGRLSRTAIAVDGERFSAELREFRHKLQKRSTLEFQRPARQLYDWLIRPLEPLLDEQVQVIVFVPGGALRTVPLAALQDRESGRYLVERMAVAVAPGLTLIDPRAIDREGLAVLAAGVSEGVQGYAPLPHVRQEIEALSARFPTRVLLDGGFDVDAFARAISERPFGIVHVASHGEFAADASQSFLVAWDEKISMDRLAEIVSSTRFRSERPLELLALSACETAGDDERAALGLAGVALRAGARSALASLWEVNDEASAELVSAFYEALASPGISRAEALRRAQVRLLADPRMSHAYYWAPFLMISNWL